MQVQDIQVGWKWLEGVLNGLIRAINWNEPLEGDGVRIVETNNGKVISIVASPPSSAGGGSAGGGSVGVPVMIQAFDSNNNPVTITVMTDGSGFGISTLAWKSVGVVDPATCAQSTITVLEQS